MSEVNLFTESERRRLTEIIQRAERVNDLDYVIRASLPQLNKIIETYRKELKKETNKIFVKSDIINLLIAVEIDAYIKQLSRYISPKEIVKRTGEKRALVEAIKAQYTSQLNNQIDYLAGNLKGKMGTVKLLQDDIERRTRQYVTAIRELDEGIEAIPTIFNKEQRERLLLLSQRGISRAGIPDDLLKAQLAESWQQLDKRYGKAGYVLYRGSVDDAIDPELSTAAQIQARKNYPLESYLYQKEKTIQQEVQTRTAEAMSAANGIYTVKFNTTGTQDSCKFWENKIVFLSELAKAQFMTRFPEQASRVKGWATVDQIRQDNTHMLKWQCRHRIEPYPIQFFDQKDLNQEIKDNPMPKIPKKINELAISKEIRKEQGLPA